MRLDDLLDAARADAGAAARESTRWLERQAHESATFLGTLLDLAEHGHVVSLACAGGRRIDGAIRALGRDVVVVHDRTGDSVVVAIGAIALVRPAPDARTVAASSDRVPALDAGFGELLGRLVGERPEVALSLVTGDVVTGDLVAVGDDVLTVRLAAADGGLVYVSTSSVASARLRSG
ncbi:MAG TPA: hypothetical protein VEA78_01865 [Acidimicrobiales bacterium]|nr:hypothetical protein [Acidimicrobiales bacterium]